MNHKRFRRTKFGLNIWLAQRPHSSFTVQSDLFSDGFLAREPVIFNVQVTVEFHVFAFTYYLLFKTV
jgi:hypothetical protein